MYHFTEALSTLMEYFNQLFGDTGIGIVCITILARIIILPLNLMQRKQLKKQRELQEKSENIKKKYEKNQKKRDVELEKLYESEAVGGMGCLVTLLQLPIMLVLYRSMTVVTAVGAGTFLLPWIDSLLYRDRTFILPTVTLVIQILPQLYAYIPYFEGLKMPKQPLATMVPLFVMNALFVFAIPSGVGLYYFVSGLFSAIEQFVCCCVDVKRLEIYTT